MYEASVIRFNQLVISWWWNYRLCCRYFSQSTADKKYECFLSSETKMPMMYMDDAIAATIKIIQPVEQIKIVPHTI
jgi:hypothetical protein